MSKQSSGKPLEVVTWGETMIRLSPPKGRALEDTPYLDVMAGGTESNMAIALSRLGHRVGWASRLPENPLGRRIVGDIRRHDVDVSRVIWAPDEKAGLLFIESGVAPRPNRVYYDRSDTAISRLQPNELDYAYLGSADVLFLTGVTPALSSGCREAWLRSAKEAKAAGSKVVVDVNYRGKLWSTQAARETMEAVFPSVDLVLCGLQDLQLMFGMPADPVLASESFANVYGVKQVVLTLGGDGALFREGDSVLTEPVVPTDIQDRIGSGDAFAAGFLHGWLQDNPGYGLRSGNAMAALKQTYKGDSSWATLSELEELLNADDQNPRRVSR